MAKKLQDVQDPFGPAPTPRKGVGKKAVDAVLGLLKAGSSAVSLMSALLASAMILYSGYVLYDSFSTGQRAYSSSWDLMKYRPEIIDSGAEPSDGKETLASVTKDYRGWLTVYDTKIDYPLVQGENDLYYASHDIYQNTSLTGAIYLAAGNSRDFSDSYNVIYGHHMDNGAMFGELDSFREQSFYDAHREGILVGESGAYDLRIFAVAKTDAYESRIYTVGNRAKDVIAFLTGDRSGDAGLGTELLFYDGKTAANAEKIVALSTCDSAETNGRLVVFARMTLRALPTFTPVPTATPTPTAKPVVYPGTRKTATPEPTNTPRPVTTPLPTPTENPGPYTLTVRYVFPNGSSAAPTYREQMMAGSGYRVTSPSVAGYTMSASLVSGTMGYSNVTVTVLYLPDASGETVSIEDYESPLGLDYLHAQMGVCTE